MGSVKGCWLGICDLVAGASPRIPAQMGEFGPLPGPSYLAGRLGLIGPSITPFQMPDLLSKYTQELYGNVCIHGDLGIKHFAQLVEFTFVTPRIDLIASRFLRKV